MREAKIFGSVLSRVSIPMMHSAAALLKVAEMRYSGANSLFLTVLLNKKYALPYRVVDALVEHFTSFQSETRTLPVLWHQVSSDRFGPSCERRRSIGIACGEEM